MDDLRLIHSSASCSSSAALIAHFSASTPTKGSDRILSLRDQQQLGSSSIFTGPYRSLSFSSHTRKNFQWRTLLDDRRPPFSFQSGAKESYFKEEEEDLSVFERLALAWRVLFPKRKKIVSPAEIAKQRLKMILISDRCSVNDKAKRKIVDNIVGALTDVVEIESQDGVRLNVSADPDLGTVYSVCVPVRRVKPEFQDTGKHVLNEQHRDSCRDVESEGALDFLVCDAEPLAMEESSSSTDMQEVEG